MKTLFENGLKILEWQQHPFIFIIYQFYDPDHKIVYALLITES